MAVPMMLADDDRVRFFPLQIRQEGEEWLVGREEISSYVALPALGVEIIELLQDQKTIGEVKAEIAAKYGQEPEMQAFIEAMMNCGFVEQARGDQIADVQKKRRLFWPNLRPGQIAWLFSPPMLVFYGFVVIWVAVLWAGQPGYWPRSSDWFYHPSLAVVTLSLFALGSVELAWHEFWHFLAARSQGVKADFSLGTRLIYVVAETDVSGVWSIPREKRYVIYLAGMIGTLLLIAFYLTCLALNDAGVISLPVVIYRLFKALILGQFWSLAWEFQFQMRTDVYYVVANFLNCKNLMQDSRTLLRSLLWSSFGRWPLPHAWKANWAAADLSAVPVHEMRAVRLYLPFYLLGTLVILANFSLNTLPITWEYLARSISALARGWTANPVAFMDALAFTTLTAFTVGLLGFLKWREHQHAQLTRK